MTDTVENRELTKVSPPARKGNPWLPTFSGVKLVTGIELRRRRPTGKGYILYGILFAIVIGVCVLAAIFSTSDLSSTNLELVLVLVLGVGMLIAPSLSATSVNGDSGEGVLAPLQMTHLTAGDLAFGKLLASWSVAVLALLGLSPFLVFAYLKSGWHLDELALTIATILLVVLAFTAVGLAWSAMTARAVASVSLAHLTTGFFAIGTLVVFTVAGIMVTDSKTVTNQYIDWETLTDAQSQALDHAYMTGDYSELNPADYECVRDDYTYGEPRTNEIAFLLLANPVVMIGETAPIVDPETWEKDGRAAPGMFALMHQSVAGARLGPVEGITSNYQNEPYDECAELATMIADSESEAEIDEEAQAAEMAEQERLWLEEEAAMEAHYQKLSNLERAPWIGLGVQLFLLVGSMALVVQRLRVP